MDVVTLLREQIRVKLLLKTYMGPTERFLSLRQYKHFVLDPDVDSESSDEGDYGPDQGGKISYASKKHKYITGLDKERTGLLPENPAIVKKMS